MSAPPTPRDSGLLDGGFLDAGGGQSIWWEEWGEPAAPPCLHLHGGPGAGLGRRGWLRRLAALGYRAIGLDQRGCGLSVPLVGDPEHDLDANTTQALVADIELVREHLGVDGWVLDGGSWGSTLALAYALEHPSRVLGLVLTAVVTTSRTEVDWVSEGCRVIYPEAWDRLATVLEREHPTYRRGEMRVIDAVAQLLRSPDADQRARVAAAWGDWEDWHVSIGAGGHSSDPRWSEPEWAVRFATTVSHYWSHSAFLDPPILDQVERIAHLPAHLVHGRRDVSGPVGTPWELHRRWPASTLTVIEDAGHGGPGMTAAWQEAHRTMLARINAVEGSPAQR